MNYILIPLLIVLLIMVVVSLVRGVVAFLQSAGKRSTAIRTARKLRRCSCGKTR